MTHVKGWNEMNDEQGLSEFGSDLLAMPILVQWHRAAAARSKKISTLREEHSGAPNRAACLREVVTD
ncbi:hypothetical protein [Bradyrhizobium sp. CCBAU 51627]|uniref:hypothetical protein n=1 Tax=Bradyrhizobium sp. CCBAU 51627 TaxID=1325088 RepID=UPI002306B4C2|nr:hypothetical protein [Bradyrhizobium sp. CCBAU 51627]